MTSDHSPLQPRYAYILWHSDRYGLKDFCNVCTQLINLSPIQYLFVYGSLRKAQDGSLHVYLQDQTQFIDTATLNGRLYKISSYPGAVLTTPNCISHIHGEVYRLLQPETVLQTLDTYEECSPNFPMPHEYHRIQNTVTLSTGQSLVAWVYLYCHSLSNCNPLENGDYAIYLPQSHN